MSFRRSENRHDIWRTICSENMDLLRGLPRFAIANEKAFRTLVTQGTLDDPGGGPAFALSQLSASEAADIWRFITWKTEFDMDATTFDALNEMVRGLPEELVTPPL